MRRFRATASGFANTASGVRGPLQYNITGGSQYRYRRDGALQYNTLGDENTASGRQRPAGQHHGRLQYRQRCWRPRGSTLQATTHTASRIPSALSRQQRTRKHRRQDAGRSSTAARVATIPPTGFNALDRQLHRLEQRRPWSAGQGAKLTTGSNDISIGNNGISGSGAIVIGTSGTHTATYIAGINGAAVRGGAVGHQHRPIGHCHLLGRFKRDIQDMGTASGNLMKLRPVTFRYKDDPHGNCNTAWSPKRWRRSIRSWWFTAPTARL